MILPLLPPLLSSSPPAIAIYDNLIAKFTNQGGKKPQNLECLI